MNKENLLPSKYCSDFVMVWGCMVVSGIGNLYFIGRIIDRFVYLDILKQNLKISAEKLRL